MSVRFHAKIPLFAFLALPAVLLLLLSGGNLLRAQQTLLLSTPGSFGSDANGSPAGIAPTGSDTEFHATPRGFGQGREAGENAPSSANHWDRLVQDLIRDGFQMGMRSGNLSQGGAGGTGMNSGGENSGGAGMNGGGRGSGGGFGQQSGGRPGGNSGSLLGMASGLSRDLGAGHRGAVGTALNVLPTLDRLSRGGMNFPINSSLGSFHFSYQMPFTGGLGDRSGMGLPSASFTSNSPSGKVDFSMAARMSGGISGGQLGGSSTSMSAGLSSFGNQSGGTSSFSLQPGAGSSGGGGTPVFSMGRPGGGSGGGPGGQGKPGPPGGKGGGKGPSASVSLQLKF